MSVARAQSLPDLPARVAELLRQVAEETGVSVPEIRGIGRTRRVAEARHKAIARCRALRPEPSLPRIGRWFGRNHGTVSHSLEVAARLAAERETELRAAEEAA